MCDLVCRVVKHCLPSLEKFLYFAVSHFNTPCVTVQYFVLQIHIFIPIESAHCWKILIMATQDWTYIGWEVGFQEFIGNHSVYKILLYFSVILQVSIRSTNHWFIRALVTLKDRITMKLCKQTVQALQEGKVESSLLPFPTLVLILEFQMIFTLVLYLLSIHFVLFISCVTNCISLDMPWQHKCLPILVLQT